MPINDTDHIALSEPYAIWLLFYIMTEWHWMVSSIGHYELITD